jgi:hypothetical protein
MSNPFKSHKNSGFNQFNWTFPEHFRNETNPHSAPAMAAGRNPICTAMGIKMAPLKV